MIAYLGVLLGMAMGALDSTIVTTALPTIAGDLEGANSSGWVMTSYLLASALSTPVWGKASDAMGRRPLFLTAVSVFLIGSVLCGLSATMGMLIAVRVLQGLGAGGLMSLGLAATGDLFSPRERGRYSGYSAAVFGGATVVGPVLGGILTDTLGWQSIFYINVPLGLISIALTLRYFNVPVQRSPFHVDVPGVVLITIALLAVLLWLEFGGEAFDWLSLESGALVAAFVGGMAAFLWWENRAESPLVPLRLFTYRVYRFATVLAGMNSWAQMTAVFLLPIYLQLVQGVPASQAGLTVVPLTLSLVVASLVSGQVVARTGRYKPIMVIGAAGGVVGFLMFSLLGLQDALWWITLASVIAGLGIGALNNVTTLSAQNAVPVPELGVATSTVTLFRSLGQTRLDGGRIGRRHHRVHLVGGGTFRQ